MSIHDETWDRSKCKFCGEKIGYGYNHVHGSEKCDNLKISEEDLIDNSVSYCRSCNKKDSNIYFKASGLCGECEEKHRKQNMIKPLQKWPRAESWQSESLSEKEINYYKEEYLVDFKTGRDRLSWDEYGCLLALMAKSRSEDCFTKIGGVALDKNGRVLGASYNGLKSGTIMPDWMKLEENRVKKSDLFIHAESNLCAQLIKGQCYTLCLTQSPCIKCCQNICALDIKRVVYVKEYEKCNKYKEFLSFHQIDYQELTKESKNNILNYIKNLENFKELL